MSTIYNGESSGFDMLVDGYIDYAKEVISGRSFPDLRDGLKPIGRRILYAIKNYTKNDTSFNKCATLVGKVMDIHPHGDASIYGSLAAMTDVNGSLNVPLLEGNGIFGRVYSTDKPAAMRYPKARLSKNADDFFRDMEACEFVMSEEGQGEEPVVLPVRYPICLINGTSGMAVSVATDVPSFNFADVIKLTMKGIKYGFDSLDFSGDIIVPDFPTGGILVRDDAELAKIMRVGKGKLKIRAKVDIVGKEIHVYEVPYGRTVEGIVKTINNSDIYGVVSARNTIGFNSDTLLVITCRSKRVVEDALLELYRKRILQNTVVSNMTFVEDEEPKILGVFDVLDEWVKWRRKVCTKRFQVLSENIRGELETLSYFIRLISNPEWRDTYVDRAVHQSKQVATLYLKEIFEGIPEDVCDWISGRSISAFNNGGKYSSRYNDLSARQKEYESYLKDIDAYILDDLQSLLDEKAGMFQRKTQVTTTDYRFSKIVVDELEDDSYCCYVLKKDGFLVKTRDGSNTGIPESDILLKVNARANSVLIGFDNYGRLLRVYGVDIPFTSYEGMGMYLPKYFGVDDLGNTGIEYKILYLSELDGKKRYLLYKDGCIGVLDTAEFVNKKKTKVNFEGVDTRVYDKLLDVVHEDDMSAYVMFADDNFNNTKFGLVSIESMVEKGRRSRTKVLKGDSANMNCGYYALMSEMQLYSFTTDPAFYLGRMKTYKQSNISGDLSLFREGKYSNEG